MYYILWFLRYWLIHWILPWIQHMHVSLNACDALDVVSWILKLASRFWAIELFKTVFWDFKSFEDSSGSVRRKRVPQVRAREDNPSGCWGSPDLVKTVLIWVLNRWVLWKENRILVFMRQYGFSRSPCVGMLFRKFEHVGVTDMFIVDVWLCRKWF